MTVDDAYKVINYYLKNDGANRYLILTAFAAITSCLALAVSYYSFRKQKQQHQETIYHYLADLWNDILDICHDNPNYLDIMITENYYELMSHEEIIKYDIYCYKVWGHIEDIIAKDYYKDPQFEQVIKWVTAYHYSWIERNPTFFTMKLFWSLIDKIRNEPNLVFCYRNLPSIDGDINWDIVAKDYHRYILGPFAPEMVKTEKDNKPRNLILEYINTIPTEELKKMSIADFGSGPGNIVEHLSTRITNLTLVDKSSGALSIAKERAKKYNINARTICGDISRLNTNEKYDMIICSNAILPKTRNEISDILRNICNHLKPTGKLVTILPSFDTIIYLKSLWFYHYANIPKDIKHAERIMHAFDLTKKVDYKNYSYADDGANIQCYHTPETIDNEFTISGLRLLHPLQKVYYPWSLTKRFDYGYFPNAKEEIWDWFVVAEIAKR